ncbi:hypothetical protein PLESTF_001568800 [Pleodorina starrii]|nr:hypothetical protein PLESTM_000948200 [Pleodorina starrii]GLC74892.1 hypothetical protein PLESTF_001568800 [Pleodorina starrii]
MQHQAGDDVCLLWDWSRSGPASRPVGRRVPQQLGVGIRQGTQQQQQPQQQQAAAGSRQPQPRSAGQFVARGKFGCGIRYKVVWLGYGGALLAMHSRGRMV